MDSRVEVSSTVASEAHVSGRKARVARHLHPTSTRGTASRPRDGGRRGRRLARTRENTLFAGSDRDSRLWVAIACRVEPCELNGVEPRADLGAVITRIVDGQPRSWLDAALP